VRAKRRKGYLCLACPARRRGEVFSCPADLERHARQAHGDTSPDGASSFEVRYRPVYVQGPK
jgi:uncharacterized C2H2 Zn-finger protein